MTDVRVSKLLEALATISVLASWHADLEADPDNQSPDDNVAHVNGLIIRECERAGKQAEGDGGSVSDDPPDS